MQEQVNTMNEIVNYVRSHYSVSEVFCHSQSSKKLLVMELLQLQYKYMFQHLFQHLFQQHLFSLD